MTTLSEALPSDMYYEDVLIEKYGKSNVIQEVDGTVFKFPSNNYSNIHRWWILDNGKVVGWNESPVHGYSFPVLGKKAIGNFYRKYNVLKPSAIII